MPDVEHEEVPKGIDPVAFGRMQADITTVKSELMEMRRAERVTATDINRKVDAIISQVDRMRGGYYIALGAATIVSSVVAAIVASALTR